MRNPSNIANLFYRKVDIFLTFTVALGGEPAFYPLEKTFKKHEAPPAIAVGDNN